MEKPVHVIRLVLLLVIGLLSLVHCARGDDSWARIQESGVLRVGVDPTYPPFALAGDRELQGIDVDLARALAEELGLTAQFSYFGYDGLYDALTTGQVDVLISALVILPEKTDDIAYSLPYFDSGLILIAPAFSGITGEEKDFNGKVVAVELGSIGHVKALELQRNIIGLEVRTYDTVSEALTALGNGKADAALVDNVSGRLFLREHKSDESSLVIVGKPVTSEPYAVASRIGDRILLAKLNEAISRLGADGRLNAIITRYLD